jgi:hypothetical protein
MKILQKLFGVKESPVVPDGEFAKGQIWESSNSYIALSTIRIIIDEVRGEYVKYHFDGLRTSSYETKRFLKSVYHRVW